MKTYPLRAVVFLLIGLLGTSLAVQSGESNPAFWKYQAKGEFAEVVTHVKHGIEAGQFQITAEENLSKGLENNKHLFPEGQWNTIGFDNVTSVHFCSIVFNQEAFNIDLDWSILCPFKLVVYTTKKTPKDVTIVLVKPTYILAKDTNKKARDVAQRIENRIIDAIKEGLSH